jgi:hypothetical protein
MKAILYIAAGVAAGWIIKTKMCSCSHAPTVQQQATNAPNLDDAAAPTNLATRAAGAMLNTSSASTSSDITLGREGARSACPTGTCGGGAKVFSLASITTGIKARA